MSILHYNKINCCGNEIKVYYCVSHPGGCCPTCQKIYWYSDGLRMYEELTGRNKEEALLREIFGEDE